jgi:hypothetical protein
MKIKKIMILGLIPIITFAFKPGGSYFTGAGYTNNHKTITERGLSNIVVNGKTLTFSAEALNQITVANGQVDMDDLLGADASHCDAEYIHGEFGCNGRIVKLKERIIDTLSLPNERTAGVGISSRILLGKAFHTM